MAIRKINVPASCGRIEGELWGVIPDLADSQLRFPLIWSLLTPISSWHRGIDGGKGKKEDGNMFIPRFYSWHRNTGANPPFIPRFYSWHLGTGTNPSLFPKLRTKLKKTHGEVAKILKFLQEGAAEKEGAGIRKGLMGVFPVKLSQFSRELLHLQGNCFKISTPERK